MLNRSAVTVSILIGQKVVIKFPKTASLAIDLSKKALEEFWISLALK